MAPEDSCGREFRPKTLCTEEFQLVIKWDDVTCPICLDYPHNGVLLQCSSYDKGCRPFICDTDHLHSNCLDRFLNAHGTSSTLSPDESQSKVLQENCRLACPLCRGEVTGLVAVDEARVHLDEKKRCCEEERCEFVGTYMELRQHAQSEHPDSHPTEIDPVRKLDWENFQQSSEIIDVLSTIHSEVPGGVVLGDYVIEYGDDDTGDEFEDVSSDEGSWWTCSVLYQVFDSIRISRNQSRSRASHAQRGSRRSSFNNSNSDDSSVVSSDFPGCRVDETNEEFVSARGGNSSNSIRRSSRRRHSRFNDN